MIVPRSATARAMIATVLTASVLSGCGSSDGSTKLSPESDAASPTASAVAYDGPEQKLPDSYPISDKVGKPFTIGYMDLYSAILALKRYELAAREQVASMGGKIIVKDDQLSVTTQVNNCETLLAQGVDAIVLYPLDPHAMQPCFSAAKAKGVTVVALDTPFDPTEPLTDGVTSSLLQSFDYKAYLRAKAVAQAKPGSSYGVIGLGVPVAALKYFTERQKYWADRFGLKFLGSIDAQTDDATGASAAMSGLLGKHPDIQTVFAYNDNTALAASTVARASGKSDILFVGNGGQTEAVDAVKKGTLFATTLVDVDGVGKNLVIAAVDGVVDPSMDIPKYVRAPVVLVTADNADDVTPLK